MQKAVRLIAVVVDRRHSATASTSAGEHYRSSTIPVYSPADNLTYYF